ncbi:putative TIM-barrel fold metal-dependent hydrolase [Mycoplana sp. BE70]|uniref:amidohydrolase family protein n=1 Tax=Mycoplana sp. BE70 TaxID=2817775 RepID=UPI00285D6F2E|nr:amidohydrolase family protein [Mycoplana sp. BE70]MDR6756429.1 putative TIM-barrel fold metal-dependent hydrolase [Mycoplana sp. BE70]
MSVAAPQTLPTVPILGVRHSPPVFALPAGACDSHVHVFAGADRYPYAPGRVYTPQPATADDLVTHQQVLGLGRVVVVQPSPYGSDNSCLLDTLSRLGPEARGVAVLSPETTEEDLQKLHFQGIRGARLNLVVGDAPPDRRALSASIRNLADRIAGLGWHMQLYADMEVLAEVADELASLPVATVLDHFAKPKLDDVRFVTHSRRILSLLESGSTYVKLSSPRRLADPDCSAIAIWAKALIAANPDRMLWGSDWPHARAHQPSVCGSNGFYPEDDGLALNRTLEWTEGYPTLRRILVDNPARLYGFT